MIKDKLNTVSIATRAWIILALFAIGLFANAFLDAYKTRQHMRENFERGVEVLVESAHGIVSYYHQEFLNGKLTEEQAKAMAIDSVNAMRFDNGNYVFIGDKDGIQLASGVKSLIGTNIKPLKDMDGFMFVEALYDIANKGGGFVDYRFKNPDSGEGAPKTSYARGFAPWQWMIGSGMNMEALQDSIERSELISMANATMILVVLSLFIGFFIKTITSPLKRTVRAMQDLSKGEGDLTQRLNEEGGKELVDLAKYFNQFLASIQQIMLSISAAGNQVATSSSQLTTSVEHIDVNLERQQNDVDMLATAMTEMLATVEEVAGRTVEANDASRQAASETQTSRDIVDRNVAQSNELAERIGEASGEVQKLYDDAKNVDTVLEVIRGVAEQTNLLALNAAIEAARAGEQGRGFAVVADEVRTLSQRTQESTLEIQTIIEKLQHGASSVVKVMEQGSSTANDASELSSQAGDALNKINKEVHTIEEMNQHIATAAEEQTVTVNDINRNVVSLRDMTASVSEESNQMAQASRELNQVSETLMGMINRFKLG
ncbi:methyl-accepting chemotaxis protein [Vibrio sonorensis]|uniref:methyl-accepting chemotaxis protein n=1 Tax=Vibrio sonorensis TaxID=1004316 RepID=UPI0008DAF3A1|nr:methyl-accepting chemotaxis protein [Vibrio sonorensis]